MRKMPGDTQALIMDEALSSGQQISGFKKRVCECVCLCACFWTGSLREAEASRGEIAFFI